MNNIEMLIKREDNVLEKACICIRAKENEKLSFFLDKIDDVNILDKNENTLATVAAFNGNLEALKQVESKGADLTFPNVSVYGSRDFEIIEYLDAKKCLNPLAITKNAVAISTTQFACNIQDRTFYSFYDYSYVPERIKCIDFLMERGADIEQKNADGRTTIHGVAATGSVLLLEALLKYNPDCKSTCNQGKNAIDWAKNEEIKSILKQHIELAK